ncbi:hypothetical protein LTR48_000104 [Friedmanniomyces endolithicus]|uniref:AB hydrolase-1 domain-containing protein n=1 Tax=Rachicladosporium monterosium TaxID=1507873 RepID=A0ABR0LCT6_9PEZI|nr:hypothetical protein LTR29_005128 [Friedmanniomyces endolithicus]KAK1094555.1 hypothetical protein LTR48_000104 [Friedmanniomyces endolithicus]KAK5146151.1 hypothetical protein LTR32_002225 [Rachicladosporium monterosium]
MLQITELLVPNFHAIEEHINSDPDFQASAANVDLRFAITSSDNAEKAVVVKVHDGRASLSTNAAELSTFGLRAKPEQWQAFFAEKLVRPYQSFWGMLRVIGRDGGVEVSGDQLSFGRHARLWRLVLDRARDALHDKPILTALADPPNDEVTAEDSVLGRYIWLDLPSTGKVKLFYETAGSGPQPLLFLHTAGSDSRQYHSLMNTPALQTRTTMYAFDLPAHGRSGLGSRQSPGGYALTESAYLEAIGAVIARLGLRDTIVCGASMAGHICLAAAIHARELGIRGAIPCEACEHLPFTQPIYELGGADASLLDPERVCGMCAPTSPEYFRRQIWWQYSSQGYGIFSGDLKFYFKGWDGRRRVEGIDTGYCPVNMLTGEYDYSCTVEASKATAEKIGGARFEAMEGLGHFPLTENPGRVLPYLLRALDFIAEQRGKE